MIDCMFYVTLHVKKVKSSSVNTVIIISMSNFGAYTEPGVCFLISYEQNSQKSAVNTITEN